MIIFNSYVSLPKGNSWAHILPFITISVEHPLKKTCSPAKSQLKWCLSFIRLHFALRSSAVGTMVDND